MDRKLTVAEAIAKLAISGECWCAGEPCSNCDPRARELVAAIHPHLAIKPAQRIAVALVDLDGIPALHRRGVSHPDECGTCNELYPCETVQATRRIRRTLTGEDPT